MSPGRRNRIPRFSASERERPSLQREARIMAVTPQSSLTASFGSLAKAQDANFRQRLDGQGALAASKLSGGPKGKLVACVESGRISKGSVAGRLIRCAVGGAQRYDAIAGELRENKEASIRNFARLLKQDLRLDNELAKLVERKVTQTLGSRRITAQAGADLSRAVTGLVSQRRAERQEIANRVLDRENWTLTPAMVTNEQGRYSEPGYYEALLAHASIREDAIAAHQELLPQIGTLDRTAGPERSSNVVHRADRMLKEMRAVEQSLLHPPQLVAAQNERNNLLATVAASGLQDVMVAHTRRLNQLETRIAELSEQAVDKAEEFREAYMEMLAAIAESKHHGAEDSAYFPLPADTADNEAMEHEPEPGRAANKSNLRGNGVRDGSAPAAPKRRVAWSETPVQVKDYDLRTDEAGYEGDPREADLKSYNQALRVAKSKTSLGLEDTREIIGAMQPEALSPSDERELIRAFDMLHETEERYQRQQRRLPEGQQNPLRQEAAQARELLENPVLQTPQVISFIEKQIYRAPDGAAPDGRGQPPRTALRSASLDHAVAILTRAVNGADGQQQPRAAGLLRTVLQDALDADPPMDATRRRTLETKLSRLDQDWPATEDWGAAAQAGRAARGARIATLIQAREQELSRHELQHAEALQAGGSAAGATQRLLDGTEPLAAELAELKQLEALLLNGGNVDDYLDDRITRMGAEAAVLQQEASPLAPSLQTQIDVLARVRDSLAEQ